MEKELKSLFVVIVIIKVYDEFNYSLCIMFFFLFYSPTNKKKSFISKKKIFYDYYNNINDEGVLEHIFTYIYVETFWCFGMK